MKIFQAFLFFALVLFIKADSSDDPCFDSFQDYLEAQCEKLKFNDTYGCEYLNGNCIMKQSCVSYKGTDENICKSIKPSDYSKKCVMKNNQCTKVTKSCSEYEKGKNECTSLYADANNKRCILQGDSCTAMENTCDLVGTTKEYCEKIIPFDVSKRCVWKDNACTSEEKKCNDVNSYYDSCSNLKTSNENVKCVEASNGCKEQYKTCKLYNEHATNKNKKDCEEIFNFDEQLKSICTFTNGNCIEKAVTCDYFSYSSSCNSYNLGDKKKCIFVSNVCEEQFKTCEIYDQEKEKTKDVCEKIIPYYTDRDEVDHYSKCVFDENKKTCERKKKDCSEITNINVCTSHIIDNPNKMCVYENNKCKEEYKSCSD